MQNRGGWRKSGQGSLLRFLPLLFSVAACTSGSQSARPYNDSVTTDGSEVTTGTSSSEVVTLSEALSLITSLEQDPLAEEAPARRMVLTAWVMASPDVGDLVPDDRYVGDLFSSDDPYSSELFMQYMFGMAQSQAQTEGLPKQTEAVEEGLRSMLATYKSLVAADESLRDRFLDELDRIRQLGKLRSYIESVDAQRKSQGGRAE